MAGSLGSMCEEEVCLFGLMSVFGWCRASFIQLNTKKTKGMISWFWKVSVNVENIEVEAFCFDVYFSFDLCVGMHRL